jgi:hypothetical protein
VKHLQKDNIFSGALQNATKDPIFSGTLQSATKDSKKKKCH